MNIARKTGLFRNSSSRRCAALKLGRVLLLGLLTLMNGCFSFTRDPIIHHSINYPLPVFDTAAPLAETLMVYRFLVSPAVNTQYLVVKKTQGKKKSVSQYPWNSNPAEMITDLLQRDLVGAGLFKKTLGQFSAEPYRFALEGRINQLAGQVINGKPTALVDVEVVLIDFDAPFGNESTLLKKRYKIATPCKKTDPDAIVEGINQGLLDLSQRLMGDVRALLEKPSTEERDDGRFSENRE
ncbi:ABC-type transport auxiliary lipoprotein family protein [Thermodesulfobacteriota bacterium]